MSYELYKVKVGCKLGGYEVDVSSIRISLTANTIPSCTLTLSPMVTPEGGSYTFSASEGLDALTDFKSIVGSKDCELAIDLIPMAGLGTPQSVKLEKWVLTRVGLTQLDASGKVGLQATIEHPVQILNTALPGIALDTLETKPLKDNEFTHASDILGSYASAIKAWASHDSIQSAETKILQERLAAAAANVPVYLRMVDGFAWPLNTDGLQHTRYVYDGIRGRDGVNSVWSHLIATLVNEYQLCIRPKYTSPVLSVIPFSPWGPPLFDIISADDLSQMSIPPCNVSPIAGVRIVYDKVDPISVKGSYKQDAPEKKDSLGDTSDFSYNLNGLLPYVGRKDDIYLAHTSQKEGAVISVSVPGWLNETYSGKQTIVDDGKGGYSYDRPPPVTNNEALIALDRFKAYYSLPLAKSVFYSFYGRDREVRLTTRLMLEGDGATDAYPGVRVNVLDERGMDAFSFFSTSVEHNIDVASGQAYTLWNGSYARMAAGDTADGCIPVEGVLNPLYY